MSTIEDPPRLFSTESGASEELKLALGAAREDLPSPARLEAILAAMPTGGGGTGPDGGGAGPSMAPAAGAAAGGWVKIAGVLSVGAALAGVGYVATRPGPVPPEARAPIATIAISAAPSAVVAPAPLAPTTAPSASAAKPAVQTSAAPAPSRPEIEILKEAQAALASNPARALSLCDEHARSHPKGSLGQEREMVRIQALIALGRTTEARAIADAFKKRNPTSAYAQRLDAMFR